MRGWTVGLAVMALVLPTTAPAAPQQDAHEERPDGEASDRVVVGFHGRVPGDAEPWARAHGGEVALRDDAVHFVAIQFPGPERADRFLAHALERRDVRYAERDGFAAVQLVPNDPLYGSQWGFPAIKAPQAWDLSQGSHAAKVAILDTGIQVGHPDLAANACGPFTSFVPSEPGIEDGHGHGTHVAGTVAAVTNNGLGVAGTSQSCLMGAKVLTSGGWGYWSWVAAGITWAADNGAHVISMSLGGSSPDSAVKDAVHYAYVVKGVLVVAAAGNSGCSGGDTVLYPAKYPEAVAVAALAYPGTVTGWFSSCGPKVELAAPGVGVLSTWRGSGYATLSGTSMATPHVSGVAALAKSLWPGLTGPALRCALDLASDDLITPGRDVWTGWGRVDALGSLTLGLPPVDPQQAPGPQLDRTRAILAACAADLVAAAGSGSVPSLPAPAVPSVPPLPAPQIPGMPSAPGLPGVPALPGLPAADPGVAQPWLQWARDTVDWAQVLLSWVRGRL